MNTQKVHSMLLGLVLCAAMLGGCAPAASSAAPAQSAAPQSAPAAQSTPAAQSAASEAITVTDMTGREITLPGPARRIVALQPSECEILFALGAGQTLVGRGEYCDYPAEVLELPSVQSGSDTNIEQVIALEPDVVLMTTMSQSEEQIQALEAAGVMVVVSDAADIAGIYESIRLVGAVVGKNEDARQLVGEMQATFDGIATKAGKAGGETIYFEVSPLEYGLWAAGKNTFMDELAGMLGLTNIFADVDGWAEVSEEQVLQRNPDYIITNTMYFGEGPTPVEEIKGRAGWQGIAAIQNNQVLNADSNEITRPGPRLADAAVMLYEFIYEGKLPGAETAA